MSATNPATENPQKSATKRAGHRALSPAHKRALAEGRAASATVNRYLEAITTRRRSGRRVPRATLEQRLAAARERFNSSVGIDKLFNAQEIRDLQARLKTMETSVAVDVQSLETAFVKIAKQFSEK